MLAQLLLAAAVFGGTWPAGKVAVEHVPPLVASTARFGLAAVLLGGWVRLRRGRLPLPRRQDLPLVLALGATGIAGYSVFFLVGLEKAPAADGSILVPGLIPVVTTLLVWRLHGERPSSRVLAGLAVALVGLVVVVDPVGGFGSQRIEGDAILLGGPVCWALYSILGRVAVARFDPVLATTYAVAVGTVMLLPFSATGLHRLAGAPATAWLAILYLSPLATVFGFVIFYEGVRVIGAARASMTTLLVPVFGVLSSVVVLGEPLRVGVAIGGVVVLAGLWLVQRPGRPAGSLAAEASSSQS